jgi:hypothetical protein
MDTTAPKPPRARSRHPILSVFLSACAWETEHQRRLWPWIALILALSALVPELLLAAGSTAKVVRGLTTVLQSSLLLVAWLVFVFNVLRQNHPQWARLLPGHVAALRGALYLGTAALAAYAAAFCAWHGWSWPIAALVVATLCAATACGLRWPLLWLLLVVAPTSLPWSVQSAPLQALALAWREAPWAVAGAVLASSGLALRAVVFTGGAGHASAHAQLMAAAAMMRGDGSEGTQRQFSAGWFGPTRWGDWLYAAWLRRLLAQPRSPVGARLALGVGPQAHWSGVFASTLYVLVLFGLLMALRWLLPQWQALQASHSGLLMGVALVGMIVPLQVPTALWASRREQALLALLPGTPSGAKLNRWLAVRLAALDVAVVSGLMCAVAAFSRLGPDDPVFSRVDDVVLGALVLGLLLTLTLWRDWARARAPSGLLQWGVIGASVAIGALAAAWVYGHERPWYELTVWTALAALPLGLWRWRRLQRLPTAWPVGHIVMPRSRSPFDTPPQPRWPA